MLLWHLFSLKIIVYDKNKDLYKIFNYWFSFAYGILFWKLNLR